MNTLGPINERTTARYTASLLDESGAAIAGSALTTLTLTLTDVASGTVINSRSNQNVLNANQVTVSEAGALVWELLPADTIILNQTGDREVHYALFRATWSSGTRGLTHGVRFAIVNMSGVV